MTQNGPPVPDRPHPESEAAAEEGVRLPPLPAAGVGSSTGIQERPAEGPIPLPPLPAGPLPRAADRLAGVVGGVDRFLAFVVLVLAFLLASFPARNSDVWLHLATGRALVEGHFQFGTDPFASTTGGVYWVNHSWLYDVVLYWLYSGLGGTALVVLKALLAVLLAGVLLRLSRRGPGLWVSTACTALTVLAVSPWLALRPVCLSFLFLALTLWFLEKPHREGARSSGPVSFWNYWPIPLLFAFWVNVDSWFLLGPLTVGLYAAGQALRQVTAKGQTGSEKVRAREPAVLALVFLVGLGACLLNPHHVYALVLPSAFARPVAGDIPGAALFQPLSLWGYVWSEAFLNPAGLAYLPLVFLGILSFALNGGRQPWGRALVWLVMLVLSAYRAQAIPFFVIVAGPILALNFQEWVARRPEEGADRDLTFQPWALQGRLVTALAGLVLVAAAWPGWLQARPYGPRQWALETDPSLEAAARQVARWHQEGKLGADQTCFNFSPDVAHYFAWFCPAEKTFIDTRLELFSPVAADFLKVRQSLVGNEPDHPGVGRVYGVAGAAFGATFEIENFPAWRRVFPRHGITHLVLYSRTLEGSGPAMRHLAAHPLEWTLLYLRGGVAIFGWQPPWDEEENLFAGLRLDLARRALHPGPKEALDRAPDLPSRPPRWWEAFWQTPPPLSADLQEAVLYLNYFEGQTVLQLVRRPTGPTAEGAKAGPPQIIQTRFSRWRPERPSVWRSMLLTEMVAWGAAPGVSRALASVPLKVLPQDPTPGQGKGPFGALAEDSFAQFSLRRESRHRLPLLLTVRSCRRALAAHPEDPQAYLLLGKAYWQLSRTATEQAWSERMPRLAQLRQVQASAAFHQALRLRPDYLEAHVALALLYDATGFKDLALKHLQKTRDIIKKAGPQRSETRQQFADRLEQAEKNVRQQAQLVKEREEFVAVNSRGQSALLQAQLALSKDLGGKALDRLLASDVSDFGKPGTNLELQLALATGRSQEVAEKMDPDKEEFLGRQSFYWLRTLASAARGDYDGADQELQKMVGKRSARETSTGLPNFREEFSRALGNDILDGIPRAPWTGWLAQLSYHHPLMDRVAQGLGWELSQESEGLTLGGLLAQEAGHMGRARQLLRGALFLPPGGDKGDQELRSPFPLPGGSQTVARQALAWYP